jgi:cold-inducible RNA-binding protein
MPANFSPHLNSSTEGIHMKDIFVGNLDDETSEDELRQLFAAYGPVDRVSIVTDRYSSQARGVAFVEMASAGDADKAITELNGTQLHGRKLDVNEARRRPERNRWGPERPRTPPKRRTLVTTRQLSPANI